MRITPISLILSGVLACNGSDFGGGGGKKSKSTSNKDGEDGGPTDPEDPDEPKNDEDPAPGSLDDDGVLTDECREVTELPTEVTKPKQVFNWTATGATATFTQVMATPIVGKLAASKNPAIVVTAFAACDYTSGAKIYAIDGKTGGQLWVADVLAVPASSVALGDFDGDGENELAYYGVDGKVHALTGEGKALWDSSVPAFDGNGNAYTIGGPVVSDVDGDGTVEVVTQKQVFDGKDGKAKFALVGQVTSLVAETDGEPGLEIVTSSGVYSATGKLLCNFKVGIGMIAARRVGKDDATALIVGTEGTTAYGYDGKTCEQRFATPFPGGDGGPYNMGDLDGDGKLDFVSAGGTSISALDGTGKVLWSKPTKDGSSKVTGSTMFDFNGDGKTEVVYNDEDFLRVYEGATGKVLYEIENSSGTLVEYPVVADVDGDGKANIVVGANDCFDYTNKSAKGVRVFKDEADRWVGTRKIWNQWGYDPLLVGDGGSLTKVDAAKIQKPWLKSPHLAGFRNNIPHPSVKDDCKTK